MASEVVLHVGLMKSGTTFIQGRLDANRDRLAQLGVLFPGPGWGRHVRAVSDLIESPRRQPGAWKSFCDEVNDHRGLAVTSMEYLGPISAARIATLPTAFPGARLTAVLTVRDLGRTVPAMWQESVKNRRSWGWADYVESVHRGGEAGRRFWRQQDAARIARRWAGELGSDRVVVVTVPPPGAPAEMLWDRFRAAAGIADADWSEAPRANESLGAASIQVMRQLNAATADLPLRDYKRRVKALAKHVLSQHRGQEDPIGFAVPRWLRRRAARMATELREIGVAVVGDPDELTPLDVAGVDPESVTAAAERDAAVAGLAEVLRQTRRIGPASRR